MVGYAGWLVMLGVFPALLASYADYTVYSGLLISLCLLPMQPFYPSYTGCL
jgi:hypothetical protein